MSEIEELYENFPTILKEKLRNKEIEFPSNTKFDYEKIYVYRAVSREITDFHEIDKNDFRSYFELGKKPKKLVKGRSLKNDAHWYGVSTFTNKEILHISSNPVYCLFVRFKDQCFFGTLFKKLASRRDELL